ncbi:MAG: 4-(cytidine 5'-diphospho)-2-C-methyl-D-erythritol kinase, partial [Chitinophaga sp.]|nr:4-(cytidine 5'-diphospho)-2-C-methyl-D-erythritol kinase [Chitinophaga sp.]
PDGFHELETVFYPVPLKDILEVVSSTTLQFQSTGIDIPGNPASNLCLKAYHLLKEDFPQLPPVQMHLHKIIPMGAGLGGGSADGAFALQLLNDKYFLGLSPTQLMKYALQLGSDCPFFILNQPCYATGRGEDLTPIKLDLSGYRFVIVHPGIHINTKWAFEQIQPGLPARSIKEIIQLPIQDWKYYLSNDFESPIKQNYPAIEAIKLALYKDGAIYASMSGSGSTVFGIYPTNANIQLNKQLNYRIDIF